MSIVSIITTLILSQGTPLEYNEIYSAASDNCLPSAKHKSYQERERILNEMIVLEETFLKENPQIPSSLRGMLIAAICRESRFNPNAKGDWRINSRGKKVAKAIGIVQMWPWWEDRYDINRRDYTTAAQTWLQQIVKQYHKNERLKRCPSYFPEEKKWVAAWVQTTRGGRVDKSNRYRCFQQPTHYKILKKWKKKILKDRDYDQDYGC
tara:strand:+ start:2586 stop:3209 length:624 start_codon:yes stop_codon:yes gene_type:complete